MKSKLLSVTIGIPVFNEENNMTSLLTSLVHQKHTHIIIEKIIVISDGSTDKTDELVLDVQKTHPSVTLISDGLRKGKMARLRELYDVNQSDICIQIDGDIRIDSDTVIEKLAAGFTDKRVAVVTGNNQPFPAKTYIEKLMNTWYGIWYDVRKNVNSGDMIQNCHSCILGMRKEFAKTVRIPSDIVSDGQYIYCQLQNTSGKFRYIDNAVVYFRLPATFADCLLLFNRAPNESAQLRKQFGSSVDRLNIIPSTDKWRSLFNHCITDPVHTIMSALFQVVLRHYPKIDSYQSKNGLWARISSTKGGV